MLNGILSNYTGTWYKIELLQGSPLFHAKPLHISKVHEESLKTKVNRLVNIDVLKHKNITEWVAFTFIIPKKKDGICSFHF